MIIHIEINIVKIKIAIDSGKWYNIREGEAQ
jgi:hypothetical protein